MSTRLDDQFPRTYASRKNAETAMRTNILDKIDNPERLRWWVVATKRDRFGLIVLHSSATGDQMGFLLSSGVAKVIG